jgi:hypothetical protein
VYRFHSPLDGCFGPGTIGYQQYDAAQTGRILVDETDGSKMIYSWDYVKIGDASHLLPVATDMVWIDPKGDTWHVAAQYKNHRHFEASADITFK